MTCKTTSLHLYCDSTHACNRNFKGLAKEWPDPATGKLSEPTATDITFVEAWTSRCFTKLCNVWSTENNFEKLFSAIIMQSRFDNL